MPVEVQGKEGESGRENLSLWGSSEEASVSQQGAAGQ